MTEYLHALYGEHSQRVEFVNFLDPEYLDVFQERQHAPVEAVPTPFRTWNEQCGFDGGQEGLARGWFIVVGGNPKMGKTILSLNMVAEAIHHEERVGFMSLEMSDPELASRFYAMISNSSPYKLQRGKKFDDNAIVRAREAIARLSRVEQNPALWVTAEPMFDLGTVLHKMQILREQEGVRYFIIDYLQLVSMGDDDAAVKTVTIACKEFRKFAKTTGSVVVCLSQFKRTVSEDYTRSPMPQGLFGGGAVEQTADQIILLDHSLVDYDAVKKRSKTWLKLTNRHGQGGDIPVLWDYTNLTAREAQPDEEDAWPTRDKGRRRGR